MAENEDHETQPAERPEEVDLIREKIERDRPDTVRRLIALVGLLLVIGGVVALLTQPEPEAPKKTLPSPSPAEPGPETEILTEKSIDENRMYRGKKLRIRLPRKITTAVVIKDSDQEAIRYEARGLAHDIVVRDTDPALGIADYGAALEHASGTERIIFRGQPAYLFRTDNGQLYVRGLLVSFGSRLYSVRVMGGPKDRRRVDRTLQRVLEDLVPRS